MTITVKAASAADFLRMVPRMIGYQPRESIVLVPFAGNKTIGVMRFDILPLGENEKGYAQTIVGMTCRLPDATGVAVIVYSDLDHDEVALGVLLALDEQVHATGLRLVDALYVARNGWGSAAAGDDPQPLSEIAIGDDPNLPSVAESVLSGTEFPEVSEERVLAVGNALASISQAVDTLAGGALAVASLPSEALVALSVLEDLPEMYEQVLGVDPAELTTYGIATLAWTLERPSLRDIALVQWTNDRADGDRALVAQMAWEGGVEYPTDLASRMWGEGPQPDPKRLEQALALVRTVAANSPEANRPGALAVAAWLSWALGRSTHAEHYAQLALDIEPEHGLSQIVFSFVTAGHLPDWAFAR